MLKLRKMITVSVMAMTVFVMSGLGSLVQAASAQPGDLVKAAGNKTVYYLGSDSKLYNIPNEDTYFSWYKDWSGVITISVTDLNSYGNGIPAGFVTMRPGTRLIKRDVTTDDTMYAVETNGTLRPITAANAIGLYGSSYTNNLTKVSDQNFLSYTVGTQLPTGQYPIGTLLKKTTGADVYYFDGVNYRHVATEAAFNANRFNARFIVKTSMNITAGGTAITGMESNLINAAQNGGNIVTPPTVVTGSGVTASLNANTPAANDLPIGTSNTLLKFNLTAANDGPAVISGVKLSAIGLGEPKNITEISIYKDNVKLNNTPRSIDSNKEAQINFTNALVIPAGTTVTLEARATIKIFGSTPTSGTKHGLSIVKSSDIAAGNSVNGSFPIAGNIFTSAIVNVGKLTLTDDSALSEVKLGDKGATIAKFKLASNDAEDITLRSITFKKNTGSTASDNAVENLKLNFDGQEVASAATISNRYVTFTLNNPIKINKNTSNKRLTVTGDLVDGAGKTIGLSVENASDVIAVGSYYGYQAEIVKTGLSERNASIKAGTVSIEKVNATSDKLRVDVDNQEVGTFKITANSGRNSELSVLRLTITSTLDTAPETSPFAKIENVEVYNKTNNTIYDLAYVSGVTSKIYANTNMGLMLKSGVTNELVVRFDTTSGATNEDYTVKIAAATAGSVGTDIVIKETSNDAPIVDITPNTVELKKVTVETAGAVFSTNALSAAYSAVIGSENIEVLNFNVKAAQNSDAYLRDLTIKKEDGGLGGLDFTTQTVSAIKLWKGSTLVKTMSSSQIGGGTDLVFTDLNEKIVANDTNTYSVTVSFVKNTDSSTRTIKFALKDASVEAADGKTINPTPNTHDSATPPVYTFTAQPSARTITMVGTGSLYVAMDNTDLLSNKDTYQLAGIETGVIASLKLKAEHETVKVTKLSIEASQNLNGLVSELSIYDGATLIGSTNIIAGTSIIEISGDKMIVPMSSKNYQVKAKLAPIGRNQTGTSTSDITLVVKNIEATGFDSNESLGANTDTTLSSGEIGYSLTDSGTVASGSTTGSSKKMAIVASSISTVSLVSDYNGIVRSSSISDGQAANAAIIAVTAPASSNTEQDGEAIKTRISGITMNVATSTSITEFTATIERINGVAVTAATSTATSTAVFTGLTGTDYEILPGQTAYFLVKVKPTIASGTLVGAASIKANLNLDSGFSWKDSKVTTLDRTGLRLTTTSIDGALIKN